MDLSQKQVDRNQSRNEWFLLFTFIDMLVVYFFLELLEFRNVDKHAVDTANGNPGIAHMAFYTDDCDALYTELKAKGVDSVSEPVTPTMGPNEGGRAVYMLDPDGVRIEFVQTPRPFNAYQPS